jgi:peptidoglycan-N-acetylglucosamine deacetylase
MIRPKPMASLSLDVDNQWAYMRVHGDSGWETFPSYLGRVVPRILGVLREEGLRVTCFLVGQDAAQPENREALASLAAAGHEIGNHSFHHLPSIARKSEAEIHAELDRAEQHIWAVTGRRPSGYRAPAFSLSLTTLRVLQQRGYEYDASTFPTFIGPIARAYYRSTVKDRGSKNSEQKDLYGGWKEALRPLRPYRWNLSGRALLEMPVTTFPGLRAPIHLTYLLFLYEKCQWLARGYVRAALAWCRRTGTPPSLLLHPLDFVGGDDVPALRFFPGMNLPGSEKSAFVAEVLALLSGRFAVMPVGDHARACATQGLREVSP